MKRNNLSEEEAQKKISAQMSVDEQRKRAALVIDNSGTLENLEHNVHEFLEKMPRGQRFLFKKCVLVALAIASAVAIGVWRNGDSVERCVEIAAEGGVAGAIVGTAV